MCSLLLLSENGKSNNKKATSLTLKVKKKDKKCKSMCHQSKVSFCQTYT